MPKKLKDNPLLFFIVKRVMLLLVILCTLDIVFLTQRWVVLAGLAIGGAVGLLKFLAMADSISEILSPNNKSLSLWRNMRRILLGQLVTIATLAIVIKLNLWLFAGALTAILLIPGLIMFYGISEGLGITHSNFM